jgi:hypothetical protein
VTLLSPSEHRDRWLEGILGQPFRFRLAMAAPEAGPEHIAAALDAAAGVLLELPRLEGDAFDGWKDRRLQPVFQVLKMAELPTEPPRAMLDECWAELRHRVPFKLEQPRPGDAPHTFTELSRQVRGYLLELRARATGVVERQSAPSRQTDPWPVRPELLAKRLEREIEHHDRLVRQYVVPLAGELWTNLFVNQRASIGLQNARAEERARDQGRPLRRRSRQRFHLAAWVLQQVTLTHREIGLFLHHVAPEDLCVGPPVDGPLKDGTLWTDKLEKAVENSLAYWVRGVGSKGRGPLVEVGRIEFEADDLLRPVRRQVPHGYPPDLEDHVPTEPVDPENP